jgi:Amt family ammonium transporter
LALLGKQTVAVVVTLVFSFVVTMIIVKLVDATIGLRITEEEEITGLDLSQHQEVGYALADSGGGLTSHASSEPAHSHAPSHVTVTSGGGA